MFIGIFFSPLRKCIIICNIWFATQKEDGWVCSICCVATHQFFHLYAIWHLTPKYFYQVGLCHYATLIRSIHYKYFHFIFYLDFRNVILSGLHWLGLRNSSGVTLLGYECPFYSVRSVKKKKNRQYMNQGSVAAVPLTSITQESLTSLSYLILAFWTLPILTFTHFS